MKPFERPVVLAALVFSGLTALVYQIVWTRLLGFAFGTTTEAISTVLAIFFGGLALGNLAAARWLPRVGRPLRVYARLEAAIGLYALLSLPLLERLDALYLWVGTPEGEAGRVVLRMLAALAVLLPPTVAMGATLPVVARAWVERDEAVGRGSAELYAANTLGAVLGAYLCGFWCIPFLGLSRTVWLAGGLNLLVALAIGWRAGGLRVAPVEAPARASGATRSPRRRAVFLACFAISGFVAIGYEIVWSKVFGIVMEGTLYGFAAVLSAYLLGIGGGSLAVARVVDRLRDLPRAFALLHVAIGASVVMGTAAIPYLPYLYELLARWAPGGDAVHLLYLVVLPVILVPTALFGAAFPILVRIDASRASETGRSVGLATAVNTAGSISASLVVGFWWIPALGMDGSLYVLLMIDFAAALALLLGFQDSGGPARLRSLAGAGALVATVSLAYGGVHVEAAIDARRIQAEDFGAYLAALERNARSRALTLEGRSSIVSIYADPTSRSLRTNGQPEAGLRMQQPYPSLETVLLGVWPYLMADRTERALVVGLGGGNTVDALLHTGIRRLDVVELEREVVRAVGILHEGRPNPLDDPRVSLRVGDGRNDLLLRAHRAAEGYDLIASQPSHPWRVGAANLFTEEYFALARQSLRQGGVFAAWLNGFRIDADALLAVVTSFERVFPGSFVVDISSKGRAAFLLLGGLEPLRLDPGRMRARLAEPRLAAYLAPHEIGEPADPLPALLARIEGPGAVFAAIDPSLRNTDDNAFVETRTPRQLDWQDLDYAPVERRIPPDAALLPPFAAPLDASAVAEALLTRPTTRSVWPYRPLLARLLAQAGPAIPAWEADLLRARADLLDPAREADALRSLEVLARAQPGSPGPHRVLARHLATRRSDWRTAHDAFARAFALSGESRDAYDAGRALHVVDPEAAWPWFERIPGPDRGAYPRLAWYEARRALEAGDDDALRAIHPRLSAWLEGAEGRTYPGGHEVASRVAWRLGRTAEARAHADADAAQRARRAAPQLRRARAALEAGRLDEAEAATRAVARELPGDSRVSLLRAELALARRAPEALDAALTTLRRFAPTLESANVTENDFRSRHGLPLRPERDERNEASASAALGTASQVR